MSSNGLSIEEKIQKFIAKETDIFQRPLSGDDAKKAIVELRNAGVSFLKIKSFLKEELNIEVSIQAISKKYKTLKGE